MYKDRTQNILEISAERTRMYFLNPNSAQSAYDSIHSVRCNLECIASSSEKASLAVVSCKSFIWCLSHMIAARGCLACNPRSTHCIPSRGGDGALLSTSCFLEFNAVSDAGLISLLFVITS